MNDTLSIRNREPLKTAAPQSLSMEIASQGVSPLVLVLPLGVGAAALMTPSQFKDATIRVAKAEGASRPPDARLLSGYRGGDGATRGTVEVTRIKPDQPERFCILLANFTTNATAGPVELRLEDRDRRSLATEPVAITDAKPQITKFVSTKYSTLSDTDVTLSWDISPPSDCRLRELPDTIIAPEPGTQEATVKAGSGESTRFQLDAMQGEAVADSRVLTLHPYDQTQLRTRRGPGDQRNLGLNCGEILGIYNRGDRLLYAVVRDSDPKKGASIWWSAIGFDLANWHPLTVKRDGKETPIMIPAEAAARPGVVFDDKLYFMGGSSYDANYPGTEVGYFHFEANTWVDGEAVREEVWPENMTARMGHSLLAAPDGRRLWVLGGYNGDGGARNDIWVYDKDARPGARWTQSQALWEPRCLFGATFAGPKNRELWIAGGFDSPGGYPTYDDLWHCDTEAARLVWSKLDYPLRNAPDNRETQYCGCALAALDSRIYAFSAYQDLKEGMAKNVIEIGFANNEWKPNPLPGISADWATGVLDCYRFDAVAWEGCIFVRQLARAPEKDKNIHYLVVVRAEK